MRKEFMYSKNYIICCVTYEADCLLCQNVFHGIRNIMIKNIVWGVVVIVVVVVGSLFLAQNATPDFAPFYSIKRFEEKLVSYTKRSPESKASYDEFLLNRRLDDLKYIISNNEYDGFIQTSLRFSTTAGNLANYIIANHLKDRVNHTKWLFWHDENIIKNLMKGHNGNDNWKFIQDDINYLGIYYKELAKIH